MNRVFRHAKILRAASVATVFVLCNTSLSQLRYIGGFMKQQMDDGDAVKLLKDTDRQTKFTEHLTKLSNSGVKLEGQHGFRAVVVRTYKQSYTANVGLSIAGVLGFALTHEYLFVLGAIVALLGWHKKIMLGAKQVKSVIRIDELGQITERVIDTA